MPSLPQVTASEVMMQDVSAKSCKEGVQIFGLHSLPVMCQDLLWRTPGEISRRLYHDATTLLVHILDYAVATCCGVGEAPSLWPPR